MDLATRLKSFLTPDQIEKLEIALDHVRDHLTDRTEGFSVKHTKAGTFYNDCSETWQGIQKATVYGSREAAFNASNAPHIAEARVVPVKLVNGEWIETETPPKSSEPEKVIEWEDGDWWSDLAGGCWQHRGNKCRMLEVDGTLSDWRVTARPIAHGEYRLDDVDGDARAAALGFTIVRKPTPASDSVKGERDKFGREIIERLGGAFIVKCENGRYSVSRGDGRWWDCIEAGSWCEDRDLQSGCFSVLDVARSHMKLAAASLELPTANPAASAKPYTFNGPIPSGPSAAEFSDLRLRVSDLEREVAALKAVK